MYRALQKPAYRKIEMTERDDCVVRTVDRYRLANIDQLMLATGSTSRDGFTRRLRLLVGAGMLDRPEIQLQKYAFAEQRPIVHALGQRGAEWMESKHGIVYPKKKGWKTANKLKSINYLDHTLGTTETMLHFETRLKESERYRFVDHHELALLAPNGGTLRKRGYSFPSRIPDKNGQLIEKGTKPDYPFAIEDRLREEPNKYLLFLEWDNATEDYERSDPLQSSIMGKFLGYGDVSRRKLHTRLYGFKTFRVLFVVEAGYDRIKRMISTYNKHATHLISANNILFTSASEVRMLGPFEPIWVTGAGKQASLLPHPTKLSGS